MLDIEFIKQNKEIVQKNTTRRGFDINIEELLKLDEQKKELIFKIDENNRQINSLSKSKPSEEEIAKLKNIKEETKVLEKGVKKLATILFEKMSFVPNMLAEDVPDGKNDEDNLEVKKWGELPKFDFTPKDHQELGENLDILDKERGTKVAEAKFYFWKGQGAQLVWALFTWAQKLLVGKGFSFSIVPTFAKENTLFGTGYLPYFPEDSYKVSGSECSLIGTSEQVLVGSRAEEILDEKDLPLKYLGFSPCFRTEAGSYGRDLRGVYRVHQFYKMEQIVFCAPEQGKKFHEECQKNIEDMIEALKLPYRRVINCVGDTGAPGYKKYDTEAWFPSQNKYKELTSNTHLTDFQTRRLNTRYKSREGKKIFPYTISATAVTERWVLAIMENNQQKDGSIVVPEVLRPFMGIDTISSKTS